MDASSIIGGQQGGSLNLGGQNASEGSRELEAFFEQVGERAVGVVLPRRAGGKRLPTRVTQP